MIIVKLVIESKNEDTLRFLKDVMLNMNEYFEGHVDVFVLPLKRVRFVAVRSPHIFKKSKESYKVVKGRIGAYYYLPKKESIYYYNRFYSLFSLSFFSVSVKTTQIYKKKIFI